MDPMQRTYAERPFDEKGPDKLSPEQYAEMMMGIFEKAGILTTMKERPLRIFASSVNTGERDWAFLKMLDAYISQNRCKTPSVILGDFATKKGETKKEDESIIAPPPEEYPHIVCSRVSADSRQLPFKKNSIDVLYERLGALWHTAEEDENLQTLSSGEMADEGVRSLLQEYQRVVAPQGKILLDQRNASLPAVSSTIDYLKKISGEEVPLFLKKLGFSSEEIESQGSEYLVLTNQKRV